jgi:hypothetical protein
MVRPRGCNPQDRRSGLSRLSQTEKDFRMTTEKLFVVAGLCFVAGAAIVIAAWAFTH